MRDGERTIRFGEGSAAEAPDLLAQSGFGKYALLTTERAEGSAPLDEARDAGGARAAGPRRRDLGHPAAGPHGGAARGPRGRARDRHRQGDRRGHRTAGGGDPDHSLRGRAHALPPHPRGSRGRAHGASVAGGGGPAPDGLAARHRAGGQRDERARARDGGALHAARQPRRRAGGPARRGADRVRRAGPRRAPVRMGVGHDRIRRASRHLPAAGAHRRLAARADERGDAAALRAHDGRARARCDGRVRERPRRSGRRPRGRRGPGGEAVGTQRPHPPLHARRGGGAPAAAWRRR